MSTQKEDFIFGLIGIISPHAKDYVQMAFEDNNAEILYLDESEQSKGVFLHAASSDCDVFYASFPNNNCSEYIMNLIRNKTQELLAVSGSKEICFNVYGRNRSIIKLVREMGFTSDMEGFHMEYTLDKPPVTGKTELVEKRFEENKINEYAFLFDMGYYQLNLENGWKTDYYRNNAENFSKNLDYFDKSDQVRFFWLGGDLVGAYIIMDNYIGDLVVDPSFRNKGYGSYILSHCISNMMINKGIEKVRLRIAASNVGARRLYERNNFREIAYFAEHTLMI